MNHGSFGKAGKKSSLSTEETTYFERMFNMFAERHPAKPSENKKAKLAQDELEEMLQWVDFEPEPHQQE